MFKLTQFNGQILWMNPETILHIKREGDTIVTLTTGDTLLVKERPEQIVTLFMNYKSEIHRGALLVRDNNET